LIYPPAEINIFKQYIPVACRYQKLSVRKVRLYSGLIAEKLTAKKEFFFVALSLGPTHSIVASCFARDQIILNKLVEELRTWKEIEKIETNIIYEVLKSGYHDVQLDILGGEN